MLYGNISQEYINQTFDDIVFENIDIDPIQNHF